MTKVWFNGAAYESDAVLDTERWEVLLTEVDACVSQRGEIVTAVRFDGIDEPAFRHPELAARPITAHTTIEIESGAPGAFLEDCLADVRDAVPTLAIAVRAVASRYRAFDLDVANKDVAEVADGLGTMIALVATSGVAAGVALDELVVGDGTIGELIADLHRSVETIVAAQRAQDWVTLADVLEHDVAPILDRWPMAFAVLSAALRTTGLRKTA
ncbi:MAG: hypothetical protein U0Q12_23495 [Vicinamibacterales bacterium]